MALFIGLISGIAGHVGKRAIRRPEADSSVSAVASGTAALRVPSVTGSYQGRPFEGLDRSSRQALAATTAPASRPSSRPSPGRSRPTAAASRSTERRGRPRCDVVALAGAVAALSRFFAAHADMVESVDANPFVALPEGEGGVALDALIIERTAT